LTVSPVAGLTVAIATMSSFRRPAPLPYGLKKDLARFAPVHT
jgi:hypothetical protein